MNNQDIDHLLEEGLSGDLPLEPFRSRVLQDSTAAFVRARRGRTWWRFTAMSAAAVFIAAMSFLLGRCTSPQPAGTPIVADAGDTVAVSKDLVAWLQAAQLFGQLRMNDRMVRAVERASRLLPVDTDIMDAQFAPTLAATRSVPVECREEPEDALGIPGPSPSSHVSCPILAQSFGD